MKAFKIIAPLAVLFIAFGVWVTVQDGRQLIPVQTSSALIPSKGYAGSGLIAKLLRVRPGKKVKSGNKYMATQIVSGAGTSGYNGNYLPTGGSMSGAPVYSRDASHFLFYDGVRWVLASAASFSATYAYASPSSPSSSIPASSWIVYGAGTAPAPTVALATPVPTITGFTPTSGPVSTSVVITGTNLTGATSVKFHGTSATSFTVNSATQITVAVPAGATTGTVSVTTSGGTATSSGSFTVTADTTKPVVLDATISLNGSGNHELHVNWTENDSPPVVGTLGLTLAGLLYGPAALSSVSTSGTTTTAVISRQVATNEPATLNYTPGNFADSASNAVDAFSGFSLTNLSGSGPSNLTAPYITGFTPSSGLAGSTVVLAGVGFMNPPVSIKLNGVVVTDFTINSEIQLTLTIPYGTTTGPFQLTNGDGVTVTGAAFEVIQTPLPRTLRPGGADHRARYLNQ